MFIYSRTFILRFKKKNPKLASYQPQRTLIDQEYMVSIDKIALMGEVFEDILCTPPLKVKIFPSSSRPLLIRYYYYYENKRNRDRECICVYMSE